MPLSGKLFCKIAERGLGAAKRYLVGALNPVVPWYQIHKCDSHHLYLPCIQNRMNLGLAQKKVPFWHLSFYPGGAARITFSVTSHGTFLLEKAQLCREAVGTPEIGSQCQRLDQVLLVGEMSEKGIDIDRRYGHR